MQQDAKDAARSSGTESGLPGGGRGRRDEVGGSGVYPASAGNAPPDAVPRTQAEWGQGDRGAAGYEDSGSSGIFYYPAQLDETEGAPAPPAETQPAGAVGEEAPSAAGTEPPALPPCVEAAEDAADLQRRTAWGGW